jgi:hypothetical protein
MDQCMGGAMQCTTHGGRMFAIWLEDERGLVIQETPPKFDFRMQCQVHQEDIEYPALNKCFPYYFSKLKWVFSGFKPTLLPILSKVVRYLTVKKREEQRNCVPQENLIFSCEIIIIFILGDYMVKVKCQIKLCIKSICTRGNMHAGQSGHSGGNCGLVSWWFRRRRTEE